jgi:putative membrane protein
MALDPANVWSAWNFEPGVLIPVAISALWYGCGVRALWQSAGRGRGIRAPQIRAFSGGLITILIALISPIDAMGDDLFSAHMTQHLLLILVAAPLIVLGEPLLPMLWAIPHNARRGVTHWWMRSTNTRAVVVFIVSPAAAWALHMAALFFWHIPAPYGWALDNEAVHALEHFCFLSTAVLFWWAVLQPAARRRLSYGMSVVYVSTAGLLMSALGAILTLARYPWYAGHLTTTAAWHLTPLQDQQLAGVIMWVPASIVYVGAACWFFVKWLETDAPREFEHRSLDNSRGSRHTEHGPPIDIPIRTIIPKAHDAR